MWKAVLILLVGTIFVSIGDGLLSKGLRNLTPLGMPAGTLAMALHYVSAAARKPAVVLGVLCHAIFFATILMSFSLADLSLVVPVSALTYLFAPFIANFYLKEDVNLLRWLGAVIIVVGVLTVFLGEIGGPAGKVKVDRPPAHRDLTLSNPQGQQK